MCLAVPARIEEVFVEEGEAGLRMAQVDFGGVRRPVCVEHVPEAKPGDYVLVHVGFALSVVDEEEARRIFETLEELGMLEVPG